MRVPGSLDGLAVALAVGAFAFVGCGGEDDCFNPGMFVGDQAELTLEDNGSGCDCAFLGIPERQNEHCVEGNPGLRFV
jgi:hypothetical protein